MKLTEDKSRALMKLKGIIKKSGGKLVNESSGYLKAEYTSSVFGFVDDVEFYVEENDKLIYFRSASRSGYYDFGVNKKRIGEIRFKFHQNDF